MAKTLGSHFEKPPAMTDNEMKCDGIDSKAIRRKSLVADLMKRQSTGYWRAAWCAMFALVVICGNTGCSSIKDRLTLSDETVMNWRDYVWAKRAYQLHLEHFPPHTHEKTFKEGFCDGYRDVATGGNGCAPPLPPQKFWTWKYQSAEGQAKVNAWYEGYPLGAAAAEQEGVGFYTQVQVSQATRDQFAVNNADENCLTCPPTGQVSAPSPTVQAATPVAMTQSEKASKKKAPPIRPTYSAATRVSPTNEIERLPEVDHRIGQVSFDRPAGKSGVNRASRLTVAPQ